MPSGIYKRTEKSNNRLIDLVGKKFSKLLVLSKSQEIGNKGQIKWNCKCDCGNLHTVTGESLRAGKSKSCGCLLKIAYNKNIDRKEQLIKCLYKSSRIKKIGGVIQYDFFKEVIQKSCFYCGLEHSNYVNDIRGGKKISDTILYYNGLDRVDSNLGYTKENIVPCCKYCNIAKSTMKQEEFKNWIIRIYNNYIK